MCQVRAAFSYTKGKNYDNYILYKPQRYIVNTNCVIAETIQLAIVRKTLAERLIIYYYRTFPNAVTQYISLRPL